MKTYKNQQEFMQDFEAVSSTVEKMSVEEKLNCVVLYLLDIKNLLERIDEKTPNLSLSTKKNGKTL